MLDYFFALMIHNDEMSLTCLISACDYSIDWFICLSVRGPVYTEQKKTPIQYAGCYFLNILIVLSPSSKYNRQWLVSDELMSVVWNDRLKCVGSVRTLKYTQRCSYRKLQQLSWPYHGFTTSAFFLVAFLPASDIDFEDKMLPDTSHPLAGAIRL